MMSQDFLYGMIAVKFHPGRVDVLNETRGIKKEVTGFGIIDNGTKTLFALAQGFFGAFAFTDVETCTHEGADMPFGIQNTGRGQVHPDDAAVLVQEAYLAPGGALFLF